MRRRREVKPSIQNVPAELDRNGRLDQQFGPTGYQQGQRKLVTGPDGALYAIFLKAITRVNLKTHRPELLAEPPVPVQFGGDILDGRLYFAAASHLYSCALPE